MRGGRLSIAHRGSGAGDTTSTGREKHPAAVQFDGREAKVPGKMIRVSGTAVCGDIGLFGH